MKNVSPEEHQKLADELAELVRQQRDALKSASLFRTTAEEARAYDKRHERIAMLAEALAQFDRAA